MYFLVMVSVKKSHPFLPPKHELKRQYSVSLAFIGGFGGSANCSSFRRALLSQYIFINTIKGFSLSIMTHDVVSSCCDHRFLTQSNNRATKRMVRVLTSQQYTFWLNSHCLLDINSTEPSNWRVPSFKHDSFLLCHHKRCEVHVVGSVTLNARQKVLLQSRCFI